MKRSCIPFAVIAALAVSNARATDLAIATGSTGIDVQILRLRRKLEREPSAPRFIQTERGVGYVFAVAVERV